MEIPRGSNLPHRFTTEIDLRTAVVFNLDYQQRKKTVLKKTIDDMTISETEVIVDITQKESLRFKENLDTAIQAHIRLADGTVLPSVIINVKAGELFDEEVI